MSKAAGHLFGCTSAIAVALWVSAASGQLPSSGRAVYGRGVDAYFAGNSSEAEQLLGQAIGEFPDDPRPYYFRALTLVRAGRSDEARSDMEVGAMLEARHPKQFAIGSALERVQGGDRLLLEEYRRKGREAAAIDRGNPIRSQRELQHPQFDDSRVLREPTATSRPTPRQSAPTTTPADNNPFADESTKPQPQPKPQPPVDRSSDPFSTDDGKAAAKPTGNNGKAPPSKLMGVLGRVLEKSVPLPSVEGLRNQLPTAAPTSGGNRGANDSAPPTMQKTKPPQTNNTEDPFGG